MQGTRRRVLTTFAASAFLAAMGAPPAIAEADAAPRDGQPKPHDSATDLANIPVPPPPSEEDTPGPPEAPPPTLDLGVDAVFGFGSVPAVNRAAATTQGSPGPVSKDDTRVVVDSYVLSGGFRLIPGLRLGGRLPLAHAVFDPSGARPDRTIFTLGNIEFSAAVDTRIGGVLDLVPKVAVTVPTGAGEEIAPSSDVVPNDASDTAPRDRFSGLRAASASRGFEDTALFASRRVGIVPQVATRFRVARQRVEIAPFVKSHAMISLSSSAEQALALDVVGGLGVFYLFNEHFDLGARAWANVTVVGFDDLNSRLLTMAEPQIRGHFGAFHPSVGALVPFYPFFSQEKQDRTVSGVSDPTFDPRFIAFRFAAELRF